MTQRYFCSQPIRGSEATLSGSEAHHLAHVMRGKPGDRVVLFDGSGAEYAAEIRTIERGQVHLVVHSRQEVDRELPVGIVLAVAMPKGDRQRWLVEKAVELGVCRLVPLLSARAVARPTSGTLRRWRRTVIEASKQCGRNRLMAITEPTDWQQFVEHASRATWRLLAHPAAAPPTGPGTPKAAQLSSTAEPQSAAASIGKRSDGPDDRRGTGKCSDALQRCVQELREPGRHSVPAAACAEKTHVVLAVGPEGGFTDQEVELASCSGFELLDLGPRILRVETAAVALAAAISLGCTSRQAR